MEIAKGVHRIACIFEETRAAYVHLFVGTEAVMLVDTCLNYNPDQEILPYMESIGVSPEQLKYIIISHSDSDHQGGNARMKEVAPHALLMCHKLDQPWIESTQALLEGRYMQFDEPHGFETPEAFKEGLFATLDDAPMDMTLEGGETFRLSPDWYVEAVHTPGHTWGHLAMYDPRGKAMAGGEAALWNCILDMNWNPIMAPTYCYVDTYLATLERLMATEIDAYSPAHWTLQKGSQVGDFLRESRNYCLHVEQKLLDLAKKQSFTMAEAIDILTPQLGSWPEAFNGALAFPLNGNLERLVNRGQLNQSRNDKNIVVWSLPS